MYQVRLTRRAERSLRSIRRGDPVGSRRIVSALGVMRREPRPVEVAKLRGADPPAWRLRVGEYRIVYEIHDDELVVLVINFAGRGEVYS